MNNFDEITKVLQKNDNFLITSHANLDGDGICSELAFYFILKKLNKNLTGILQIEGLKSKSF